MGHLRIGFVVDNEFNDDPRVGNEARALQRAGFDVRVLCMNYGKHANDEVVGGIPVTRVPVHLPLKNILFGSMNTVPLYHYLWARQIVRFIRKYRIDVIHVADLFMARSGYLAKRRTGARLVVDLKENYPAAIVNYEWIRSPLKRFIARPHLWRMLEKPYLAYADRIVVMCDVLKEILLGRYAFLKPGNVATYMNVPDTDFLLSQPVREVGIRKEGAYVVVYFGGVAQRRGILTVTDAVKLLRDRGENVKFLVIGPVDTPERDLFSSVFAHPDYRESVIHVPWITLAELPSYLAVADAGISPIVKSEQHDTTIANKMFQYSLFGKPLLVSDCVPQVRIVDTDRSGLVFRSGDAGELAEKILFLKNNPEEARHMGENGRQAVLKKYNLVEGSKELIDLYEQESLRVKT